MKHTVLSSLLIVIIACSLLAIMFKGDEMPPFALAAFTFSIIAGGFGIVGLIVEWGRAQSAPKVDNEPT